MKAIVVEAKGKKIIGKVADESHVVLASNETIDHNIANGVDDLVNMLEGKIDDPTQKRCSRCIKMGRVPFHPLEDFSLLKNGKRHSQCKVCRTEQSNEWCAKRAEHRKAYHKEYHTRRPRRYAVPKGLKVLMATYTDAETEAKVDVSEALFVGFPNVEDIQETS